MCDGRRGPAGSKQWISVMDESPSENFYEELKPQLHRRIARTLRGSKKVVDLGCGSCDLAQFLAKSNRQEVIGIDISDASFPPEAQMSSAQGEKVRCVKKDAGALSFLVADSMDAVVTMWALHEMSSPIRVLREARRILRPDGLMLILDFPRGSLAQRLWNENYYSRHEVADMLKKTGFVSVRSRVIARGQIIWAQAQVQPDAAPERRAKVKRLT